MSTDDALTWQSASLAGDVDFHALDHEAGRSWGIDAVTGRLMTSVDERAWTTIEAPNLVDLAAAPGQASTVIAVTRTGRLLSLTVDGRLAPLLGAPRLFLIDWPTDDASWE